MKTDFVFAAFLLFSLPAFGQWTDPSPDSGSVQDSGAGSGSFKRYRISISAPLSMCISGNSSDQTPQDSYSSIYPFGFGLGLNFEYNFTPAFSSGSYFGFQYFGTSNDLRYTDSSFSPPLTITYHFSAMTLLPIHVFFKLRFPFDIPSSEWFLTENAPELRGFSLYFKPHFGLTYMVSTVSINVDDGYYNSVYYPSQSLDYWESQSLFTFKFCLGFEYVTLNSAVLFFEITYSWTSAPNVVEDYTDKSDPIGMIVFEVGSMFAF